MTKKIAILGSCASEDWFHFQDARFRLDAVVPSRYQLSSLISVMAEPVSMAIEFGDRLKTLERKCFQTDFDKSFLPRLVEMKPDVLIVELLSDSRHGSYGGVIEVQGSWVSSTYILKRTPMAPLLEHAKHLSVIKEPDEYFILFREAARKLRIFLARELPDCQVILNQLRWAEYFVDEHDTLKSFNPWEQNAYFRSNLRLSPLERIFADEVPCDLLSVDEFPIFADARHIWGKSADHYVKPFYSAFTQKLGALMSTRPHDIDRSHATARRGSSHGLTGAIPDSEVAPQFMEQT